MNQSEARKIALERVIGLLQSDVSAGGIVEEYGNLPVKEIGKIEDAMINIIQEISRKLDKARSNT